MRGFFTLFYVFRDTKKVQKKPALVMVGLLFVAISVARQQISLRRDHDTVWGVRGSLENYDA